ncbi:hypothetical protein FH972_023803 [Carpinus fangiana]|uniref:Structural maintenance of chromosomes protein n=1 Tax=Carpinus fangiana TaxID=176857 RepID=A0A5N6KWW7_9ROSI|nr:hypothetical protein FH972_023803 [Carpinus fangiana]
MDAISFVLGIKSSHLRSSHLRDLVYRGRILKTSKIGADGAATDGPNGEANANGDTNAASDDDGEQPSQSQRNDPSTAWVMAVYEDDAGDEQKWKRTITSSGQSEYRINNRVVNAKDYNEALEAEQILIKARNFLVFQGDVEAIASQSPKDLTRLIEQISGSLEYKAEYDRLQEESDKAAEDQAFKHNTRRGINAEIKQYSEQKKEADSFNRKADERDDAVVTHVLWKLYQFQKVIEESGAEIQRHQEEVKQHRRDIEKYEQRLDDAKKEQAKVDRDVKKAERQLKATEKQIEEQRNGLVPIDEKISISNRNLDKYRKRAADVTKERDTQSKAVDQLNKDLAVVQKAQKKWEDDWKKQTQKQGRQLSDGDIQEYNRLRGEVNKQAASEQMKVDNYTRQLKTDEETVNNLKTNVDTFEQQLAKHNADLTELRERRDAANAQIKQIAKDVDAKKKQYNKVTSERLKSSQHRTELEEKLQAVLNKILEADDGRRQTEKEIKAKETVSSMKRMFPGVRGRVHELCKPKAKKYDAAVSTALGRHFDAIVVDTEKTANECINYLREQRKGSATFIPLDSIQTKPIPSNMKGMHKKMRLALDTIDYDDVYHSAMSYALSTTMVCDDLDTAKHLCYEKRVEAKAVTLDGTVIHKGGNMTGGQGQADRNARKWEDSDVDNLHKVREGIMHQLRELPNTHQSIAAEETLRSELSGLESRLTFAKDEVNALDKNIDSKKKEQTFVQKQLQESKPKFKQQATSLEQLRRRIEEFQAQVSQVEDSVFAAFCRRLKYNDIREYEAQQGSLQQENSQKKLEFSMQRSKLENQLAFETKRLQATTDRVKGIENQAQRDEELVESLEEEKEALEAQVTEYNQEVTSIKTQLEKAKKTLEDRASKVTDHRKEVQKRSKDVDSVKRQIAELEAEVQRNASARYGQLRKCKIEQIKLPLTEESEPLDVLPTDDIQGEDDGDAMDIDGEDPDVTSLQQPVVRDYGIDLDFDDLDGDLKDNDSPEQEKTLLDAIAALDEELSTLNPNMRAVDRLTTAKNRLEDTETAFEEARRHARDTREEFETIREKRAELFNKAFEHISNEIGPTYKKLTRSAAHVMGGSAYLDAMEADDETPFLGGLKYHAMPPAKRFRDMDALSGGEKTIAALALLFAIHSFAPSPFFVLDEVDAALDNANVAKVAKYLKENAGPGTQFIVISLKTGLFQESECLVGVLRDQGANTSRAVTLDLRKYQPS